MNRWIGLLGIMAFIVLSYALSENRRRVSWKLVTWGMLFQFVLAFTVLGVPALGIPGPLRFLFDAANDAIVAVLSFSNKGSEFVFGNLVDGEKSGFIFAFQVLPTIIFMASLMTVLYHLGLMQKVVSFIASLMQKTMGISGAESLSTAANIFVGQTEAPLVVKPYVATMTRSELFTVMVGGMASVAGGVLAAYVGLLKGRIHDIAGHLLTASVMSAPATILIAKLMVPETIHPETLGRMPSINDDKLDRNWIEAAARGANEGLGLALNVAAMLIAFIALIALINSIFIHFGHIIHFEQWGSHWIPNIIRQDKPVELTFQVLLGWFFAPVAWLMGVPWSEATAAGVLLGEKIVFNEFVAYLHLSQISSQLSDRTMVILSYALCGFANFCSIAIQIGGIGGMAPTRKSDIAELGIRSVIAGSFSTFLVATVAGILI